MTEATESIKDKIRKLLAKADNTACTVEEAKSFNEKAHELMAKFNLDRAMLGDGEKDALRTHMTLQVLKRPWSSAILHGICRLYYCKWYFTKLNDRMDTITIVGEESNVAVAHAVCVMVLRAVQSEARITRGGRSFMTGAAMIIAQRCQDMAKGTMIAGPGQSTALVVLGGKEEEGNTRYIEQTFGIKFVNARKSRPQIKNASAFGAGQAFGRTVNLSRNLIGSR